MDPLNRSVPSPLVCTNPEETTETKAPPRPPAASRPSQDNQVVALPEGLANGDSRVERRLREAVAHLPPGDALELSVGAGADVGVKVEGKTRLRVQRETDGSITVTVDGHGEVGVGKAGAAAIKGGVAAGTRFHFPRGDEANAADLCDALVKGATVAVAPAGTGGLVSLALTWGDRDTLPERVVAHATRVSAISAGGTAAAQIGAKSPVEFGLAKWDFASAKAQAMARDEVTVDLEKGELLRSRAVQVTGDAGVQVPFAFKAGANGKVTATLSAAYALPIDVKQALREGRMTPADAYAALAARAVPDGVTASVEVEVGARGVAAVAGDAKAKLKSRVALDVKSFLADPDPTKVLRDIERAKWFAEGEVGAGPGFAFDVEGNKLDVSAQYKRNTKLGEGSWSEVLAMGTGFVGDADANLVDARRAAANLY